MSAHRFPKTIIVVIISTIAILLPALCWAQGGIHPEAEAAKLETAACPDLTVFPRLPLSTIVTCDKADSIEVAMPLKPDANGYAQEKLVRGRYEFREYQLRDENYQQQAFDNLTRLLGSAGFTVKYSSSPSTITARNQDTWILINVSGGYYNVKVVRSIEDPWTPVKDAQEISREMEAHKRVALYGIQFSPDNQGIVEEKSTILGEVLTYLKENPALPVDVESHKMSNNGNAADDLEITRRRAKAVVDWLEAHGIAAVRLQAKALGRTRPVTENDTPLEIQKNERIELAKTTP
jgi:outer membrane protein OmpA-like peptidoglycan-associated protein